MDALDRLHNRNWLGYEYTHNGRQWRVFRFVEPTVMSVGTWHVETVDKPRLTIHVLTSDLMTTYMYQIAKLANDVLNEMMGVEWSDSAHELYGLTNTLFDDSESEAAP